MNIDTFMIVYDVMLLDFQTVVFGLLWFPAPLKLRYGTIQMSILLLLLFLFFLLLLCSVNS